MFNLNLRTTSSWWAQIEFEKIGFKGSLPSKLSSKTLCFLGVGRKRSACLEKLDNFEGMSFLSSSCWWDTRLNPLMRKNCWIKLLAILLPSQPRTIKTPIPLGISSSDFSFAITCNYHLRIASIDLIDFLFAILISQDVTLSVSQCLSTKKPPCQRIVWLPATSEGNKTWKEMRELEWHCEWRYGHMTSKKARFGYCSLRFQVLGRWGD